MSTSNFQWRHDGLRWRIKLIYNIQDFNPEQVLAVGYTKSKIITDAMMWFDKFSCKRSDLVITVGRDLVETVENRFKGKKVPKTVMINNWIDENEIYPLENGLCPSCSAYIDKQ